MENNESKYNPVYSPTNDMVGILYVPTYTPEYVDIGRKYYDTTISYSGGSGSLGFEFFKIGQGQYYYASSIIPYSDTVDGSLEVNRQRIQTLIENALHSEGIAYERLSVITETTGTVSGRIFIEINGVDNTLEYYFKVVRFDDPGLQNLSGTQSAPYRLAFSGNNDFYNPVSSQLATPGYSPNYIPGYSPDAYTPNYVPGYGPVYNPNYVPIYTTPSYTPAYTPNYTPGYQPSYKPFVLEAYTPTYNRYCALINTCFNTVDSTGAYGFRGLKINGVWYLSDSVIEIGNNIDGLYEEERVRMRDFVENTLKNLSIPYSSIYVYFFNQTLSPLRICFTIRIDDTEPDIFENYWTVTSSDYPVVSWNEITSGAINNNCSSSRFPSYITLQTPGYVPTYTPGYSPDAYTPTYTPAYAPSYAPNYLSPDYGTPSYTPIYAPSYKPWILEAYTPTYNAICSFFSYTYTSSTSTGATAFTGIEVNGIFYPTPYRIMFANSTDGVIESGRVAILNFLIATFANTGFVYQTIGVEVTQSFNPNYTSKLIVKVTGVEPDLFTHYSTSISSVYPVISWANVDRNTVGDFCGGFISPSYILNFSPSYTPVYLTPNYTPDAYTPTYTPGYYPGYVPLYISPDYGTPTYTPLYTPIYLTPTYTPIYLTPSYVTPSYVTPSYVPNYAPNYVPIYSPSYQPFIIEGYEPAYNTECAYQAWCYNTGPSGTGAAGFKGLKLQGNWYIPDSTIMIANHIDGPLEAGRVAVQTFVQNALNDLGIPYSSIYTQVYEVGTPEVANYRMCLRLVIYDTNLDDFDLIWLTTWSGYPSVGSWAEGGTFNFVNTCWESINPSYIATSTPSYIPVYLTPNYTPFEYTPTYDTPNYLPNYIPLYLSPDYGTPTYTPLYLTPTYITPTYVTPSYSPFSYVPVYLSPSYTPNYIPTYAPNYTPTYLSPTYSPNYETPSYLPPTYTPVYTPLYLTPSYTPIYITPSYGVPTYTPIYLTPTYVTPTYIPIYITPTYTPLYLTPTYVTPSYIPVYLTPTYTPIYTPVYLTPTYLTPTYLTPTYVTPSYIPVYLTPTYVTPSYTPIYTPLYAPIYVPIYIPNYVPNYIPDYTPIYLTPTYQPSYSNTPDYVPSYETPTYHPNYTPLYTPTYDEICAGTGEGNKSLFRNSQGDVYTTFFNLGDRISVYKGNDIVPSEFDEMDMAGAPWETEGSIDYLSSAISSDDVIHIFYTLGSEIKYVQFDTSTDTYGAASSIVTLSGSFQNIPVYPIVDSNDKIHIVYFDFGITIPSNFTTFYTNNISGSWKTSVEINDFQGLIPLDAIIDKDDRVIIFTTNLLTQASELFRADQNDGITFERKTLNDNLYSPTYTPIYVTPTYLSPTYDNPYAPTYTPTYTPSYAPVFQGGGESYGNLVVDYFGNIYLSTTYKSEIYTYKHDYGEDWSVWDDGVLHENLESDFQPDSPYFSNLGIAVGPTNYQFHFNGTHLVYSSFQDDTGVYQDILKDYNKFRVRWSYRAMYDVHGEDRSESNIQLSTLDYLYWDGICWRFSYVEIGTGYIPNYIPTYVPDYSPDYNPQFLVPTLSPAYTPYSYIPNYTPDYLPQFFVPVHSPAYTPFDYSPNYTPNYIPQFFIPVHSPAYSPASYYPNYTPAYTPQFYVPSYIPVYTPSYLTPSYTSPSYSPSYTPYLYIPTYVTPSYEPNYTPSYVPVYITPSYQPFILYPPSYSPIYTPIYGTPSYSPVYSPAYFSTPIYVQTPIADEDSKLYLKSFTYNDGCYADDTGNVVLSICLQSYTKGKNI